MILIGIPLTGPMEEEGIAFTIKAIMQSRGISCITNCITRESLENAVDEGILLKNAVTREAIDMVDVFPNCQ